MAEDPISPVSPQRSYSTDKELVNDPGIESIPCDPIHFCRQCGIRWIGAASLVASSDNLITADPITIPSNEVNSRPTFKRRCTDRYHKHPWWHLLALSAIAFFVATIIALAIHFRPKAPIGIYNNGTGLVVLDRGDNNKTVDVFFQHQSGQIRHAIFVDDETKHWDNGRPEDNVLSAYAPPPRKGTPLMAVSYKIGSEITWRIFYIDVNDLLQESVGSTTTEGQFPSTWSTGSLGLKAFKARSSPHAGLSVCRNMLWSTDPSGLNNGSLVLFYGGADGANHMLTHETQNTAWTHNYTFEGSSAGSGIECTSRGDEIVDSWMIDAEGRLIQASLNFNPRSNQTAYPAGQWKGGIIYDKSIQSPTSVSAIKYTGNYTTYENSTFIYIVPGDNIVTGFNIDTSNRSHVPATVDDSCIISNSPVVSGSKIASVALRTGKFNHDTGAYGEVNKVFIQTKSKPTQIMVMSGTFDNDNTSFEADGTGSQIRN